MLNRGNIIFGLINNKSTFVRKSRNTAMHNMNLFKVTEAQSASDRDRPILSPYGDWGQSASDRLSPYALIVTAFSNLHGRDKVHLSHAHAHISILNGEFVGCSTSLVRHINTSKTISAWDWDVVMFICMFICMCVSWTYTSRHCHSHCHCYRQIMTLTLTLTLFLFQQPQSRCLIRQLTQTMTP